MARLWKNEENGIGKLSQRAPFFSDFSPVSNQLRTFFLHFLEYIFDQFSQFPNFPPFPPIPPILPPFFRFSHVPAPLVG